MSYNNNDNDPKSTKNFMIAMAVFMTLMFGIDYFTGSKQIQPQETTTEEAVKDDAEPFAIPEVEKEITYEEAMLKTSRVSIENDHMKGSVDLNGGLLDSLLLKDYKQTTDEGSGNVALLQPKNTSSQFYYSISYNDKTNKELIAEKAVWTADERFNVKNSLRLKTQTQNGLVIERLVTFDEKYMVTVKDRITNVSSKNVVVAPVSSLNISNPKHNNYAVVHEGLVGSINGKVDEVKYADIDESNSYRNSEWLGFTELYWLTSIINKDKHTLVGYSKTDDDAYRISTKRKNDIQISPEKTVEISYQLYAGPKDIKVLRQYQSSMNINKFEMAIDFGWFFMITKPLVILMDILEKIFTNMGLVILVLTILFKIITYPLTKKSFESAAKMKEIQPKLANIQKLYAYDKMRMNQEIVALYKKEQVSPMSGCLPMLLQAPIFFCLYKVFFISIEMRHAPLFGWIKDLSAPDNFYLFNLFGLFGWTPPSFLQIGLWPLIMGATMFMQQKLSSASKNQVANKTKEQKMQDIMMLILPIMFTYICSSFPVGVVVYWTISNVLGMIQQYMVNKKYAK